MFVVFALVGAVMVARLAFLQVVHPSAYASLGASQRSTSVVLAANRGTIVDRNGLAFAVSADQKTLWADPALVTNPQKTANVLSPIIGRTASDIEGLLRTKSRFVYLARKLESDKADQIKGIIDAKMVDGVYLLSEPKRFNPAGDLAQSVIGSVDTDNVGIAGLEKQYNLTLKGTPGKVTFERDPDGHEIASAGQTTTPAAAGQGLQLSLDRSLQYEVDRILKAQVDKTKTAHATAIVMKTKTGEILSLVNVVRGAVIPPPPVTTVAATDPAATTVAPTTAAPTTAAPGAVTTVVPAPVATVPVLPPEPQYEPAQTASANYAVTDVFEPGSINKLVTLSAAVEEHLVDSRTVFDVPSYLELAGHPFKDHVGGLPKTMTVAEIIAQSSNFGTIKIAQRLGADRLDSYLRKFGFGSSTELGFPGESRGILIPTNQWSESDIGSIPIGQGISVTPMQMLLAYNTIANHGVYVPPRLVLSTVDEHGLSHPVPATQGHRIVTQQTADIVTKVLEDVVYQSYGTGNAAQVAGFAVAGKTGTANVPLPGGTGYETDGHISSFAGFTPAQAPEFTIIVVMDHPNPKQPYNGGDVAAPAFAEIAKVALRLYQIAPDGRTAS